MKKLVTLMLAGVLGAGVGGRVLADEAQNQPQTGTAEQNQAQTGSAQSVTMSDLPSAVRHTFDRESKGGRVEELKKQTKKDGSVVYSGEVVKEGKGTDLRVSSTGHVLEKTKAHEENQEQPQTK